MSISEPPTVPKALSDIMTGRKYGDPEREAKGRRDLAEAKIADAINKALAVAPPLTGTQISRLSGLLKGGQR